MCQLFTWRLFPKERLLNSQSISTIYDMVINRKPARESLPTIYWNKDTSPTLPIQLQQSVEILYTDNLSNALS